MISSSNSLIPRERDAPSSGRRFTPRHVRYRAVPRTNRTLAPCSRAYQSKSARVERAGIVMQSCGFWPDFPVTAPIRTAAFALTFNAGSGNVTLPGGSGAAGVLYAPKASVKFTGGGDWYGSVIAQHVTDLGGAAIHYDRHLQSESSWPAHGCSAHLTGRPSSSWRSNLSSPSKSRHSNRRAETRCARSSLRAV